MSKKTWPSKIAVQLVFIAMSIAVIYPLIWMVFNSLKPSLEVFTNSWWIPQTIRWLNYYDAWVKNGVSLGYINTIIVAAISIPTVLLLSAMATFALSRLNFRWNSLFLYLFIAGNMIPQALILIPLFIHLRTLQILGIPYLSLIMVYIAFGFPFHVLVQMPFFIAIPRELEEASYMDGASTFGVFWRVDLPLAKSGIIIGGVFQFFYTWNEYVFAHITTPTTGLKTLPLTIADLMLRQEQLLQWGSVFSGLVMAIGPCFVMYLIFQRQITQQAFMGALKG